MIISDCRLEVEYISFCGHAYYKGDSLTLISHRAKFFPMHERGLSIWVLASLTGCQCVKLNCTHPSLNARISRSWRRPCFLRSNQRSGRNISASEPQTSGSVCTTLTGISSMVPFGITRYASEVPAMGSERGTLIVSAA